MKFEVASQEVQDNGGGKFGQWDSFPVFVRWMLFRRIPCKHGPGRFRRKVGIYSKFYCSDCDGEYFVRHDWSE